MFCSTIIPTIGRESLDRAVQSVINQDFKENDFEVIVVNDSGLPLTPAVWQQSNLITIINTNRRERSVARNTGAAIAKGQYLHFLDDDDWLAPDALENLWKLANQSNANWIYGSTQLVDRKGEPIIQLHHQMNGNCFIQVMAGEWIPLQSSLIEAEAFFSVGGFDSQLSGPEDIDICRKISRQWDMVFTKSVIAFIGMGIDGSSTDYNKSLLDSQKAREKILLDQPGVFKRMHDSADTDYWFGKIARIFLSSILWNIGNKRFLTAVVRLLQVIGAMIVTIPHVLSIDYWKAIMKSHESEVFLHGFKEANKPVMRRE